MLPCIFDNQLGKKISHLLSSTLTVPYSDTPLFDGSLKRVKRVPHEVLGGSISMARACKPTMVCVSGESKKLRARKLP